MLARTQLPTGKEYWPINPKEHVPIPYDIAHKLAQTNRFGGSCFFTYSVAQHSILGAKAILRDGYQSEVALAFLFHDAAEPLGFGDLPAPIKYGKPKNFVGYFNPVYWLAKLFTRLHKFLEYRIMDSLLGHYGIPRDKATWEIVKKYDYAMLYTEKYALLPNPEMVCDYGMSGADIEIKPMDWTEARDEWLRMYHYLVWG